MGLSFNKLLTSPVEGELVAALEAASRPREGRGRDDWRPALVEIAASAEGRMQIESLDGQSSRYVCVAWWSDHQGRKLVRVAGGNRGYDGKDLHHSRLDEDPRPPLWHVCPDRVFRVKRGDAEPVWLATCACGETGAARELGWSGERCGPCHDRREEGMVVVEDTTLMQAEGSINALAFEPGGERIAVSVPGRTSLYHLRTGGELVVVAVHGDQNSYRPLAFSPDSRHLAGGDPTGGQMLLWDTGNDREEEVLELHYAVSSNGVGFSPDGRYLASVSDNGVLQMWRFRRADWPVDHTMDSSVFSFDFSPDSSTIVLGKDRELVVLRDVESRDDRQRILFGLESQDTVLFVRFIPVGGDLVALSGNEESEGDTPWHLRRWSLTRRDETHHSPVQPPSAIDMSPDGRYLAMLRHDQQHSPAVVHFWDLDRWRPFGWIEWNPDDILRCLAFSPDGRWLATGSTSGVVKLYPWRSLLEG